MSSCSPLGVARQLRNFNVGGDQLAGFAAAPRKAERDAAAFQRKRGMRSTAGAAAKAAVQGAPKDIAAFSYQGGRNDG